MTSLDERLQARVCRTWVGNGSSYESFMTSTLVNWNMSMLRRSFTSGYANSRTRCVPMLPLCYADLCCNLDDESLTFLPQVLTLLWVFDWNIRAAIRYGSLEDPGTRDLWRLQDVVDACWTRQTVLAGSQHHTCCNNLR